MTESNGIRDFTPQAKEPIRFKLHGDVFEAAAEMPAGTLLDFVGLAEQLQGALNAEDTTKLGLMVDLFDKVLLPKSAELFKVRMRDLEKPVTVEVFPEVLGWLFQQYTGRPLAEQDSSSDGSGSAGGTSPAASPSPESTPTDSALTGS